MYLGLYAIFINLENIFKGVPLLNLAQLKSCQDERLSPDFINIRTSLNLNTVKVFYNIENVSDFTPLIKTVRG